MPCTRCSYGNRRITGCPCVMPGPQGPVGATGYTGADGVAGVTGVTGVAGSVGPTGVDGATGADGIAGATGVTGVAGVDGVTGPYGNPGPLYAYSFDKVPQQFNYDTILPAIMGGDFTFEMWVYPMDNSNNFPTCQNGVFSMTTYFNFYISDTCRWTTFDEYTNPTDLAPAVLYKWTHIACSRNTGTTSYFINGVKVNELSDSQDYYSNNDYYLGNDYNGLTFVGYISNVRLISTPIYSTNFTPSIAPLTIYPTGSTYILTAQTSPVADNGQAGFTPNSIVAVPTYILNFVNGVTGATGALGIDGVTGPPGIDGSATNTGATGPTGPTGSTGAQGADGSAVNTGATGPTGSPQPTTWVLLNTVTVGSPQANVDFFGISQSYQDLKIDFQGFANSSGSRIQMFLNGDTTDSAFSVAGFDNGTWTTAAGVNADYTLINNNIVTNGDFYFPYYTSPYFKNIRTESSFGTYMTLFWYATDYLSFTSPITDITLVVNNADQFGSNSIFKLYGRNH